MTTSVACVVVIDEHNIAGDTKNPKITATVDQGLTGLHSQVHVRQHGFCRQSPLNTSSRDQDQSHPVFALGRADTWSLDYLRKVKNIEP